MNTEKITAIVLDRFDEYEDMLYEHTPPFLLWGDYYSMAEDKLFEVADMLCDTDVGTWHNVALTNGGWFMLPAYEKEKMQVTSTNGWSGLMSPEAFGITCALFACSRLSFAGGEFGALCSKRYYLLKAYAEEHAEAMEILRAID
jgi:hypothetical protein